MGKSLGLDKKQNGKTRTFYIGGCRIVNNLQHIEMVFGDKIIMRDSMMLYSGTCGCALKG